MPRPSRIPPRPSAAAPAAVEVLVKDTGWRAVLPRPEGLARRVVAAALAELDVKDKLSDADLEVGFCLADDAEVQKLNRDFRAKDAPTNVLAFPSGEKDFLGDVVLALGVVKAEARAQGKSLADHTAHLMLHGFLHLAGFDHQNARDAAMMEAVEIRILKALGIADPYAGQER